MLALFPGRRTSLPKAGLLPRQPDTSAWHGFPSAGRRSLLFRLQNHPGPCTQGPAGPCPRRPPALCPPTPRWSRPATPAWSLLRDAPAHAFCGTQPWTHLIQGVQPLPLVW